MEPNPLALMATRRDPGAQTVSPDVFEFLRRQRMMRRPRYQVEVGMPYGMNVDIGEPQLQGLPDVQVPGLEFQIPR